MRRLLRIPHPENYVLTGPEDPLEYYSMPVVGRLYLRRLEMILELIADRGGQAPGKGGRVLDIGYGSGILFPELARWSGGLFGIDVHRKGHDVRKAMEREGIAVELSSGNIHALPYKDESFRCVIVVSVLEHLADPEAALREISRVLDKDGVLVVGFPGSSTVMKAAFRLIGFHEVGEKHISSLTRILAALGKVFVIEKKRFLPGFLPLKMSMYAACLCRKPYSKTTEKRHGTSIAGRAQSVWGYDTPMGKERIARRSGAVLKLAGVTPGMMVLEVGAGVGTYTEAFSRSGSRIIAIDLSLEMLGRAKGSLKGKDADFIAADAEALPFKAGAYDAVIGNAVLHHVDPARGLGEILRVLRPGGAFAFAEPNMLNPQVFLQKNVPFFRRYMEDSPEETAFVRWKVRALLRRSGVRDASVEPFDFMHPRLPGWISFFTVLSRILEGIPIVREMAGSVLISGRKEKRG